MSKKPLDFEKPIDALYKKIEELKQISNDKNIGSEIETIENKAESLTKKYILI